EEVTTDRLEARGGEGISLAQERDRAVGGDRSHAVSIRRAHGGSGTERSGTPCGEGEPPRRGRCPTGLPVRGHDVVDTFVDAGGRGLISAGGMRPMIVVMVDPDAD